MHVSFRAGRIRQYRMGICMSVNFEKKLYLLTDPRSPVSGHALVTRKLQGRARARLPASRLAAGCKSWFAYPSWPISTTIHIVHRLCISYDTPHGFTVLRLPRF